MKKEYEEMQPEIYEYNDNLYKYESEFNNDSSHNFMQKYLLYGQINDMKIDSYDKFIDKMLNKADFKYMTNGEAAVTGVLDFSELGPLKMGAEAVVGKNFITGEEYSDGQRGFILATLGGGSLLGKVISKINAGKVSNKEIASVEKNSGVTLSMNGAGEFDNLFKKITKDVVDEGKNVVEGKSKATLTSDDLGELLGSGGNKDVYAYGQDKAVGILKDGKPQKLITDELDLLNKLDELGLPTVNAFSATVDGKEGLMFDRFVQGSKDIVQLSNGKVRIVGDSSLLNQQSISDLTTIRNTMVNEKIKIDDLQFLIDKDGHVVIADPLNVYVKTKPSNNNLRMIDLLIESARNNLK